MIVKQTTTLIFEYPQDYMQEQEWCKTKDDRWIHKSTDTLCSVYENQISYAVGASVSVKTEPQRDCDNCKRKGYEGCEQPCLGCGWCDLYEPTDEPQTDTHDIRTETHECVKDTHDKSEPQTEDKLHDYCKKRNCVWWSRSLRICLAERNGLVCKYKSGKE